MTVLHPQIARWRFAESGKTGRYLAALDHLAQAPAWRGEGPRFLPGTVALVDRQLTCRGLGYATLLFQLCHAVKAAAHLAPRPRAWMEPLLGFPGTATGKALRRHLLRLRPDGRAGPVRLEERDLVLGYGPGETVRLAWGVLPRLAALAELLLTAELGEPQGETLAVLDAVAAGPDRAAEVARHKDRLQGRLDRWLDEAQRPRQQLDKFERLVRFLSEDGAKDRIAFDDAALLAYWQAAAADPARFPDVRHYRTAFRELATALLAFRDAEALLALRDAAPLGGDRDESEVEVGAAGPDAPAGAGEARLPEGAAVGWASPLPRFALPPLDGTDILNEAERRRLGLLLDAGPAALPLLRSLLRAEVMGAVQAQLTEVAGRRKADAHDLLTLAVLDRPDPRSDAPPRSYAAVLAMYEDLALRVGKMRRALAHLRRVVEADALDPEALAGLDPALAAARRAFEKIARQGFRSLREQLRTHPEDAPRLLDAAEPFLDGADLLEPVAHRLAAAIEALRRLDAAPAPAGTEAAGAAGSGLAACLAADRPPFAQTLARLYGDPA